MSGAGEAALVIGLISGTIAIIEAVKEVYDAAKDVKGLPEDFRAVAQKLPLVNYNLRLIEGKIKESSLDEESCDAMELIITTCEEKATRLRVIFAKCIPDAKASTIQRYRKALHTLGKDRQVEVLMKGILEDVQLLAGNSAIKSATGESIKKLQEAIDEISAIKSSVADDEYGKGAFVNTNYGGKQFNNNNLNGTQTNNNAETINQGMGNNI